MAARKKIVSRITAKEPEFSWESERYNGFATWERVIYWFSVLSWVSLLFWLVRLILYLVLQDKPKPERLNAYAMQGYVFGWITIIVLVIAMIVFSFLVIASSTITPAVQ
jgi:uncharacterized membrane protein